MLERIDPTNFKDKIEWLWEKVRTQDYFFDDTFRGNHIPFLQQLFQPDSEHFYNESGMVSIVNIQEKVNANIHFLLWDRKYSPKEIIREGREVLSQAFEKYSLNRITATIPSPNKGAIRLAVLLGMKFEGTIRECFLYEGKYYDFHIYGVLRREFNGQSIH